jgi:hypothetical protein
MLRSLKDLERYKVSATDGDIGSVADFLMDDRRWVIRYLVVDTGGFLGGRRVLITPMAFRQADYSASRFRLKLTMDKVKNSPSANLDLPVSRQYERLYTNYYGYPYYWEYGGLWGRGRSPGGVASDAPDLPLNPPGEPPSDAHLRSAKSVTGHHMEATDGSIGHVKDFIIDDETWAVRYMVIATSNWWPGKSVLIAPEWTTRISWLDRKVYLAMTRDAVRSSPEWSATYPVERDYEAQLYRHYAGIPGWAACDRSLEKVNPPTADQVLANATEMRDAWVARHEEEQLRSADAAVVGAAREARMP